MPYCILIDALAKGGNIWEAKMLFNDTKEKGVKSGTTSNRISNETTSISVSHSKCSELVSES
jgi:pentatricopeptide repeat protein